jgi:hypothetical protein
VLVGRNAWIVLETVSKMIHITRGKNFAVLHSTKIALKSFTCFDDLSSHKISGPFIKWRFLRFHLRSSHARRIDSVHGVASNDFMFILVLIKIHQLVQNFIGADRRAVA